MGNLNEESRHVSKEEKKKSKIRRIEDSCLTFSGSIEIVSIHEKCVVVSIAVLSLNLVH